jgi:hypothetical protein
MSPPSYMVYTLMGGVAVVCLIAGFIVGWNDAWPAAAVVLPILALYAVWDRRARRREMREAQPTEGSDARMRASHP